VSAVNPTIGATTAVAAKPRTFWQSATHLTFYALPRPDRGNFLAPLSMVIAFVVAIARATILMIVCLMPVILTGGPHALEGPVGRLWAAVSVVFFEELARRAYGDQAKRPTLALIAFLVLVVVFETFAYLNQAVSNGALAREGMDAFMLSRTPAMMVHVLATVAMVVAFRHRRLMAPIFAAVVLVHVAFDFWAPQVVSAVTGVQHAAPAATKGV
jgi:hypothetical protein